MASVRSPFVTIQAIVFSRSTLSQLLIEMQTSRWIRDHIWEEVVTMPDCVDADQRYNSMCDRIAALETAIREKIQAAPQPIETTSMLEWTLLQAEQFRMLGTDAALLAGAAMDKLADDIRMTGATDSDELAAGLAALTPAPAATLAA